MMGIERVIACGFAALLLAAPAGAGIAAGNAVRADMAAVAGDVRLAQAGGKRAVDREGEREQDRQRQTRTERETRQEGERARQRETQRARPRAQAENRGQIRRARPESDAGARRVPDYERPRERERVRRDATPERRRVYERERTQIWHKDRPRAAPPVTVPGRWVRHDAPRHRHLRDRRYGRVWWCDDDCRIVFLFGFTIWVVDMVLSERSPYAWPVWESLEYNRTGETALWESRWGYVEFTPTRTYTMVFRFGRRHCRDFTRIVVRHDGWEKRYHGTACRNPHGEWWIVS
jgi:hypothetical protein